uniref:Uncharacterized protein n=1 Tax=Lepeophtheirus salmonis TaxID=72036 RepID=A0A0K2UTM1_LEPSM
MVEIEEMFRCRSIVYVCFANNCFVETKFLISRARVAPKARKILTRLELFT